MKKNKIFWIAGEKSGDLHASFVIKKMPEYYHFGIGGNSMKSEGLKNLYHSDKLSVMGFMDVVKKIFTFWFIFIRIKKILKKNSPSLVVLVDFPGLNMRVAKYAKKLKIPVLYYVCPKFWAWNKRRLKYLKRDVDLIASIFPFEQKLLLKNGIKAIYVGNPIYEQIIPIFSRSEFLQKYNISKEKKIVGLFPGSRNAEVKRLLPIFKEITLAYPSFEFVISISDSVDYNLFKNIPNACIARNCNYDIMKYCNFLILKSGTTTLEATFFGTPFVVVYIADKLMYFFGKKIVKLKYIALPNILMNKSVIPELIQKDVNLSNIKKKLQYFMNSKEHKQEFQNNVQKIKEKIGKKSASSEVVKIIKRMIK